MKQLAADSRNDWLSTCGTRRMGACEIVLSEKQFASENLNLPEAAQNIEKGPASLSKSLLVFRPCNARLATHLRLVERDLTILEDAFLTLPVPLHWHSSWFKPTDLSRMRKRISRMRSTRKNAITKRICELFIFELFVLFGRRDSLS